MMGERDMDITRIPGSLILEVARIAFATPDADLLCFGESDWPSPAVAHQAAVAALDAGETRYPDVRGLPELRSALAEYLTTLHDRPVAEARPDHRVGHDRGLGRSGGDRARR
jgi:aspartate aminotransferase